MWSGECLWWTFLGSHNGVFPLPRPTANAAQEAQSQPEGCDGPEPWLLWFGSPSLLPYLVNIKKAQKKNDCQ